MSFLPDVSRAERPHKRVRQTSVTAYANGRESFTGRKADVLRWLAAYFNRYNVSPTSAELAQWTHAVLVTEHDMGWDALLLYVRRGLSDLQQPSRTIQSTAQAVKDGKRQCAVTGRECCVWRVIERGTRT